MKITLTEHAKRKIAEREITEEQVIACVENPDSFEIGQSKRLILQRRLNGKVLRVIIEQQNAEAKVITAYESRAKRYEI